MAKMDSEKLVTAVTLYPAIYDISSKLYHNKTEIDKCWDAVAHQVEQKADVCKKTWQNLRNSYNRHLRQTEQKKRSGAAVDTSRKRDFYLAEHMSFLKKYLKHGQSISSFTPANEDDNDADERNQEIVSDDGIFTAPQAPPTVYSSIPFKYSDAHEPAAEVDVLKETKGKPNNSDNGISYIIEYLKRKEERNESERTDCPELSFFKSLIPEMKTLTSARQRKFKLEVMTALDKLLTAQNTDSNSRYHPYQVPSSPPIPAPAIQYPTPIGLHYPPKYSPHTPHTQESYEQQCDISSNTVLTPELHKHDPSASAMSSPRD